MKRFITFLCILALTFGYAQQETSRPVASTDWFRILDTDLRSWDYQIEQLFTEFQVNGTAIGADFQGAYSNAAIDLSDVTLNHSGSAGPVMIRAGSYGSPVTSSDPHQSGMIRLYSRNAALTDDGTCF